MVRDAAKMSPDEEVAAAKARLRDAFRRVGEEFKQTANDLQNRVRQTTSEVQDRVVGTADQLAGRLEGTVDHVQQSLQGTVEHAQARLTGTVDHLQGTLTGTVSQLQEGLGGLSGQLGAVVREGSETIRRRPLEALATALVAGLIVGSLTGGRRASDPDRHPLQPRPDQPQEPPPFRPDGQPPSQSRQTPSLFTNAALGGVGKMVWDVVQREYLTPDTIKGWMDTLLRPKRAPR